MIISSLQFQITIQIQINTALLVIPKETRWYFLTPPLSVCSCSRSPPPAARRRDSSECRPAGDLLGSAGRSVAPSMRTSAGSPQVQPEECAPLNPPMLSTVGSVGRAGSMLIMVSGRKATFESSVKNTFDSNVLTPDVCDRSISINDWK